MTIKRAASLPATGSVEAPGSDATSSQYPLYSLAIEGCVYRGEGNANLVVALPSERKVIRLRKSSSPLTNSNSKSSNPKEEDEARGVRREVDFIRRVISGHLGAYVRVPEILRCDLPEIARLSEQIRAARPEQRRGKDIVGAYATKYPDYTYLADDLPSSDEVPTFCVEIKPKQAHLCRTDRILQKCPYCLTQYYKKHNGSTKHLSDYCPFDLFSGDAARMDRALCALLSSPQNNLKIFKNGSIVYDETAANRDNSTSLQRVLDDELQLETESLLKLLRCALARPFDVDGGERRREEDAGEEERDTMAPKRLDGRLVERARTLLGLTKQACDTSTQQLPVGSVLERILRMQRLHRRGADVVAWMRAGLGPMLRDSAVYGELEDAREVEVEALSDYVVQDKAMNVEKDVLKYYTLEECYETLRNYLLFCTAKDCSILIAFQRIDKDSTILQHSINRIDVSEDQRFLVSVRILDLDMKKLQCIEKHRRRDNDVLQATIKELENQLGLLKKKDEKIKYLNYCKD